jgi:hypothetical protein
MSSQHKAPLAAFVVVSIACLVVVVNALRSDALAGFFTSPTQAVVAGARLIQQPDRLLSTEAEIGSRATAGLAAAPEAAQEVVPRAVRASSDRAPKHRHTAAAVVGAAQPVAVAPVVPEASGSQHPTSSPGTQGHAPQVHAWAGHQTHQTLPSHLPAYGLPSQPDHQSEPAPDGHAPHGWGQQPSHDDHGNDSHGHSSSWGEGRSSNSRGGADDHGRGPAASDGHDWSRNDDWSHNDSSHHDWSHDHWSRSGRPGSGRY